MATHDETIQAVESCLSRIGENSKVNFNKFSTETYTAGGYRSGKYTYEASAQRVALTYWFSSFSNRKEEALITFGEDGDAAKLEKDLRECLNRLRQFVNRKKGMF
jgi:hypothetical protein